MSAIGETERSGDADGSRDVSVVIVSHNTLEELRTCLGTLGPVGNQVVVVDSGSSDGTVALVSSSYPNVRVLALDNVGFAAAANAGIAEATRPYVLLLNADARPLADAVVRIAALAARRPRAGAIGPLLRSPNGTVQRSTFASPPGSISLALWVLAPTLVSGAYRGWQLLVNARGRRQGGAASGETRDIVGLEYLQGSALLLRREAFDAVGGFDERFFMYCEEADLCYRLREAGWSVLFAPDCEFVHVGEASSKHRPDEMYGELLRSHVRLLAKHRGIAVGERARRLVVLGLRLRAALHAGPRRAQYALASARLASDNQLRLTFGP